MIRTSLKTRTVGIRQRSLCGHCKLGRATELVFVLATGALLVLGGEGVAQTLQWDVGTDDGPTVITGGVGNWTAGGTGWNNGADTNVTFTSNANAVFGGPDGYQVSVSDIGGAVEVNNITVSASNISIIGPDALTISGTVTIDNNENTATLEAPVTGALTIGGVGILNLGGGTGGAVTQGTTGLVTVTGGTYNGDWTQNVNGGTIIGGATTITGDMTLNDGTGQVNAALTLNGGAGTVNLGAGVDTFTQSATIDGNLTTSANTGVGGDITGALTVNAAKTTIGPSTVSGAVSVVGGELEVTAGQTLTASSGIANDATLDVNGAVIGDVVNRAVATLSGAVTGALSQNTGGAASLTVDGNSSVSNATNIDSGSITVASGQTLTATGGLNTAAGTTFDLNGNVTGTTTMGGTGTLSGIVTGQLILNGGGLTVDGATAQATGGTFVNADAGLVVNQAFASNVSIQDATATYDQNAAVTGNLIVENGNANVGGNVSGAITQTGGAIVVDGATTTTSVAMSGGTLTSNVGQTLQAGTVTVGNGVGGNGSFDHNGTLTGDLIVNAGSSADLGGNVSGTLSGLGTTNISNGVTVGGNVTQSGQITNTGNGTHTIALGTGVTGANIWTSNAAINAGTGALTIETGTFLIRIGHSTSGTVNVSAATLDYGVNSNLNGVVASNIIVQSGTSIQVTADATVGRADGAVDFVNAGTVTIAAGQTLSAGSVQNTGTIEVGVGSSLEGTGNTINNAGVVNVADGGIVTDANDVNNLATGQYNFAGAGTLNAGGAGAGTITNDGIVQINAAGVQVVAVGSDAFVNQGTGQLNVTGGTLNGITILTNTSTSGTAIQLAAGATLGFTTLNSSAGTLTSAGTLNGNVAMSGAGQLDMNGGSITGTLMNTSTAAQTVQGTVTGLFTQNGAASQTTLDGATTLTAGFVNTLGTVTVDNALTLAAASSNAGTLDVNANILGNQTITNTGAMTLAGDVTGAITQTAGTLDVDGNSAVSGATGVSGGTLTVNAGQTLTATGGLSTSGTGILDLDGTITGNVDNTSTTQNLLAGTIAGTYTQNLATASTLIDGASSITTLTNTDGTVTVDNALTLAAASSNAGTLDVNANILGNQTITNTGAMDLSANITGNVTQNGPAAVINTVANSTISGSLINTDGTIEVNAGQSLTFATLSNNDLINVQAGSTLQATANTINNAGIINVFDGATVTDAGAINNLVGGSFLFAGNGTFNAGGAGSGTITNDGLIQVNSAGGQTVNVGNDAIANSGAAGMLDINGGTMNGITTITNTSTSASAIDVAAGATLDYVTLTSSAGTITSAGTLGGNIALTGVSVLDLNAGSTVTGNVLNQSTGNVTLSSTITGTYTANGAVGSTVVDGATTVTGLMTIATGSFSVSDGFTALVGDAGTTQNEFTAASMATVNVGAGSTLSAVGSNDTLTFDNGSTLNLAAVSSIRAGTSFLNGTTNAVSGASFFSGNLAMGSGSVLRLSDGAANDTVTITNGAITAATGAVVSLDVDLTDGAQLSDTIVANTGGPSSGSLALQLNDLTSTTALYGATGANGLMLVDLTTASTLTASGTAPVDPTNAYIYTIERNSDGDIVLVSALNSSTVGLTGAIAVSQSLIASVINRPSSPLVTSLSNVDAKSPCRPGTWARISGGKAEATGTASAGTSSLTTTSTSGFQGVQVGADMSCFNAGGGSGWDMSVGLIAGANKANTSQPIPNSTTGLVEKITQLDLQQLYGGAYVVGVKGRFSFDAQVRYEKTDYTVNSINVSGPAFPVNDTKFSTSAVTVSGAVSYAASIPNTNNLILVPTAGFSITQTQGSTIRLTNNTRIELEDSSTKVGFVGATLAKPNFNQVTGAQTALFGTLTHYFNFSDDPKANFIDATNASTSITSSPLANYTELSLGYSYSRELTGGGKGSLRKVAASVRANAQRAAGVKNYGLAVQVRLQF
jgi:fibronectin-binding autotransporter adhesin